MNAVRPILVLLATLWWSTAALAQGTAGCFRCFVTFDGDEVVEFGCKLYYENGSMGCILTQTTCNWTGGACTYTDPNCFLAGTLIMTPDGMRTIEQIQSGDAIISVAPNGERVVGKVSQLIKDTSYGYSVINGHVRVTGLHRFLVPVTPFQVASISPSEETHRLGTWREARALQIGDLLTTFAGATVPIERIDRVDRGVRVYNLEVEPFHNYFADGILVHNKKPQVGG